MQPPAKVCFHFGLFGLSLDPAAHGPHLEAEISLCLFVGRVAFHLAIIIFAKGHPVTWQKIKTWSGKRPLPLVHRG